MADYTLDQINSNECIGNSLSTINYNFTNVENGFTSLETKINKVSADDLQKITQLIPGNNIIITPTQTQGVYQIDSIAADTIPIVSNIAVVSATNVGSYGARVFKRKAPDRVLEFRRLVSGGSNIVIGEEGDLIKITAFDSSGRTGGEINTASNQGPGVGLAMPKSGVDLPFKTLVAGSGISLTSSPSTVNINNTRVLNTQSVGAGASIVKSSGESNIVFKTIKSGSSNTIIQQNENDVEIYLVESLSAANTGLGAGFFKEKDVFTNKLIFKGLATSTPTPSLNVSPCNVTLTENSNSVLLTVTDKVTAANMSPITYFPPARGQSGRVFKNKNANTLNFKTLIPGNNINITNSANEDEIIISAIGEQLSGGEVNIGTNVGGGREVFKEKNGVELVFRTLSAGPGVQLTQTTNNIVISAASFPALDQFITVNSLTASNLGAAVGIFDSVSGTNLRFKSLSGAAPFITVLNNPTTKTITLSVGNVIKNAENDATADPYAAAVYKEQEGSTLKFRKILAGAGITVQQQSGNVLISNSYTTPTLPTNVGNGFKNKIINGNFDVWQWQNKTFVTSLSTLSSIEVSSLSLTGVGSAPSFGYLADRVGFTPGSKVIGPGSLVDPIAAFSKVNLSFSDTAATGALSGCSPTFAGRLTLGTRALSAYVPTTVGQRIENVRSLAGKTVTFSFWARSNNAGSNQATLSYLQCYKASAVPLNLACLTYPSTSAANFTLDTQWQRYATTFTLPEISEGFWNSTWSGFNGENATWDSFTQIGIEIPGSQSRTVDFAGLQFEENSSVTDFERRPIAAELALCQRYYETGTRTQTQFATNSANLTNTQFKVTKRKAPVMLTDYGVLLKNYTLTTPDVFVSNHVFDRTTVDSFTTSFTGENNFVNAKPYIYNWAATAEF